MLEALGFTPAQEAVYTGLVARGRAGVDELAGLAELSVAEVLACLEVLTARDLVAESGSVPGAWKASPPGVALQALISDRRSALARAEVAVVRLEESHRPEPGTLPEDHLEVVSGVESISQRFHQIQLGARSEVLALVTNQPVAVRGTDNESEDIAVSRGVVYRVVIESESLSTVAGQFEAAASLERDEQIRVTDRVPTKLIVADRSVALVPAAEPRHEPLAVVVRSPGLVAALVALFEQTWRTSWPLSNPPHGVAAEAREPVIDDVDRAMLALLLSGSSDARVARQLDVGLRTVQRRVRSLMDEAGATTRMQLGWAAHERGWLTRS